MKEKSRRTFVKLLVAIVVALLIYIWNRLTINFIRTKHKKFVVPFPKNELVSFYKKFIIVKRKKTVVFSSHCTHLGCTINKIENNRLVCPCHGSEFDLDGKAVKGPAYKNLEELSSQIISDGTEIEIDI